MWVYIIVVNIFLIPRFPTDICWVWVRGVRDSRMTTSRSSLLLVKPEVSVSERGSPSVSGSGSSRPGNFTIVQASLRCAGCQSSAHAPGSTLHTGRYMGLCCAAEGGWEVSTVAPCNNRKWAAAAKNNLNVWHTETHRDTTSATPQQQSNSSRHHGVTTYNINNDTMWQNGTQWDTSWRYIVTLSEN